MSVWDYRATLQDEVDQRQETAKREKVASTINSRCDSCHIEQHCGNCHEIRKSSCHSHDSKAMKDFVVKTNLWETGVRK
jgi:hypothetical protein